MYREPQACSVLARAAGKLFSGGTPWSGAWRAGESSRTKRRNSVTSAVVASARSRGTAPRRHPEERLREGGAGESA